MSPIAADFLDLIASKQFGRAAEHFALLVDRVVGSAECLCPETEQQLQLQPTPAYRKLRKLLKDKEAVQGLLHLLVCDDSLVVRMLHAVAKITSAPGFAAQIASCSKAAETMQQVGAFVYSRVLHVRAQTPVQYEEESSALTGYRFFMSTLDNLLHISPKFTEEALRFGLLSLIMATFPFPGSPPRRTEPRRATNYSITALSVRGAFSGFIDTPSNLKRMAGSEASSSLVPWLSHFFEFLSAMLGECFEMPKEKERLQKTAGSLLNSFNNLLHQRSSLVAEATFQPLMDSVQELKPFLDEAGRTIAESFVVTVRNCQEIEESPGPCPAELSPETALLQLRDPNLSCEMLGCCVSVLDAASTSEVESLLENGCAEVLSNVLVERLSKASPTRSFQEVAQGVLFETVSCLGTVIAVGLSKEKLLPEDVDKIGSRLLSFLTPAFAALDSFGQARYIEVLMYCFNGGTDSPSKWQEYTRAMVGVIARRFLNRTTASLVWHFIAVLFGCYDSLDGRVVSCYEDIAFRAKKQTAVGSVSSFLTVEEVSQVAQQALQRLAEACRNVIFPSDRIEDVAFVVLQSATEYSAVINLVKTRIGPLIQLLKLKTLRLLEDFRGRFLGQPLPQSGLTTAEQLEQWESISGLLLRIFKVAFDSLELESQARKKFLQETASNGGIIACQATLGIFRCMIIVCPEEKDVTTGAAEQSRADVEIASEIWAAYAVQFALKKCNNEACWNGVVETCRKTFKICGGCNTATYCSRSCQVTHWKNGHKAQCKKAEGKLDEGKLGTC